jgi:hypothetical protein
LAGAGVPAAVAEGVREAADVDAAALGRRLEGRPTTSASLQAGTNVTSVGKMGTGPVSVQQSLKTSGPIWSRKKRRRPLCFW